MSGTYVGLRLFPQSAAFIRKFCEENCISVKASNFEQRLHVTLIYSRKQFEMQPNPSIVHTARISGFNLFSNSQGIQNVLVAELAAGSIAARHRYIRETYGATHDYPDFKPHITLMYDWDVTRDISTLAIPDETLFIGGEYVEDLNLKWGESNEYVA